jgi:DNA-binding MurR/RpiR family transcriptional regulator
MTKHDRWALNAPGTHILNRFAEAIMNNLRQTLSDIEYRRSTARQRCWATAIAASIRRRPHHRGARGIFFTHMQVIRPNSDVARTNSSSWPQYVLNMNRGDVLIIFDIRRYEQEMATLAAVARPRRRNRPDHRQWALAGRQACPAHFPRQIEAPSAWDSSVVTLFLVEALIEAVQSATWDETRERMKTLEELFEQSRLVPQTVRTDTSWNAASGKACRQELIREYSPVQTVT